MSSFLFVIHFLKNYIFNGRKCSNKLVIRTVKNFIQNRSNTDRFILEIMHIYVYYIIYSVYPSISYSLDG